MLCVCLSVSVSVSVWEGGDSWLREVTGKHGSNFRPFGRLIIEFLFWDHGETAVLIQILAGRSREVTGANFCHLATPRRRLNFSSLGSLGNGRFGPNPGREVTGGQGGHGRLRAVTEGENGGKWRNGRI